MKEIILKVEGMVCGGCENRVKNSLLTIEGIENVNADYTKSIVTIECKEDVSENIIKERIDDLGFNIVEG